MATKKITIWLAWHPLNMPRAYEVVKVQNTTEFVPEQTLTKVEVQDLIDADWTVNVARLST